MYFRTALPIKNNPIDFEAYFADFGFEKYIYKDKRARYRDLLKEDDKFVADFAAAVFATLHRAGYTWKSASQRALECCRDILVAEGFRETFEEEIRLSLRPATNEGVVNHVLIAGCQDSDMLNRRVNKAATVVRALGYNCVVVFSGKNPDPSGASKVRILDESQRMTVLFRDALMRADEGARLPPTHDLRPEGSSTTTQSNIARLFEGDYLSKTKDNNLVIVSSTFHLIRLARETKDYLEKHNGEIISQLVLVGAENHTFEFFPQDAEYLKLLMFEVFHYFSRSSSV